MPLNAALVKLPEPTAYPGDVHCQKPSLLSTLTYVMLPVWALESMYPKL